MELFFEEKFCKENKKYWREVYPDFLSGSLSTRARDMELFFEEKFCKENKKYWREVYPDFLSGSLSTRAEHKIVLKKSGL